MNPRSRLLKTPIARWAGGPGSLLFVGASLLASACMLFFYGHGGPAWPLGFVALVPWLRALDASRHSTQALFTAWAMSVALTAALFAWFGLSLGRYVQIGQAPGLALLLVLAPLFQPQVLAFALLRHWVKQKYGRAWGALAGSAAWLATEWMLPKVLGDTLGHGLYPSALLRQGAELGGAAGLTLMLLLANEAAAAALARRTACLRAVARPLALAALVPLALAGFGLAVSPTKPEPEPAGQRLRMGLVQSNIVDYERLRREKGTGEVVREVLDTHFAMSHEAVERQQVQALLWSETVYPTTFGRAKSEAGAELDQEIAGFVGAAGVPLVFGTYERDDAGEYNVAAFLAPDGTPVGSYRKTRLFPFTEALPAWLDSPQLRAWLPWAGTWRAGTGARVFPLRLADGREVPVLPLICLDDVDPQLAIDGARLGATLILTVSNDSWFAQHPQGARLHLAVAAFRSIETRLPQFRVTNNGYSALIDAHGQVVAGTAYGERALLVGELPVREPTRTLMVAWGDWVGRACAVFLLALAAVGTWRLRPVASACVPALPPALPAQVVVLTPVARVVAGALRALVAGSLLWMAAQALAGDGPLATNTLAQLRAFVALVLVPEVVARALLRAGTATLTFEPGRLVLTTRRGGRTELETGAVAALQPWRLPLPAPGVTLTLKSGARWRCGLANVSANALQRAWAASPTTAPTTSSTAASTAASTTASTTASSTTTVSPAWAASCADASLAPRGGGLLQHGLVKFVLFPFLLAVPAFHLHQRIAFGGGLGEYQLYGLLAYTRGFLLWWAAWALAVVTVAAVLRAAVEAATLLAAVCRQPPQVLELRRQLERFATAALYLGISAWLAARLLGA